MWEEFDGAGRDAALNFMEHDSRKCLPCQYNLAMSNYSNMLQACSNEFKFFKGDF